MTERSSDSEKTLVNNLSSPDADGFKVDQVVGGKYKVVSLLGRGGIGSVYKVVQIFLAQSFALKTLNSQKASDQLIRRFQNEARAASLLSHPNLVKVIDFGLLEGQQPYLVMDLVEGLTLSEYLKQNGLLSLEQAVACFAQVCLGLSYAHDQGIVHRDIKPSNVMISSNVPFGAEGFVKVVDFGIAKLAFAEDGEAQSLTTTGEVFGSPLYMSPEQCSGTAVDQRSDIYSLGCVLFESLTGTSPFVGQTALSTMMLHQGESAPSLKEASLGKQFPPELEQIVSKLLAKSPADRYQNLGIVANDLAQVVKGAPVLGVADGRKKQTEKQEEPLKMSRRELQLWLCITALGAGLFGAGVTYCLIRPSQNQVSVKVSDTGMASAVQPAESQPKENNKENAENAENAENKDKELFKSSALGQYEGTIVDNILGKKEVEAKERQYTEEYVAIRAMLETSGLEDRKNYSNALERLLTLQEVVPKGTLFVHRYASAIEERIAFCHMRLGQFPDAEKHLKRAGDIAKTLGDKMAIARVYQEMAGHSLIKKRAQNAFNYHQIAATIFESVYRTPGCKPAMAKEAVVSAAHNLRTCCALAFQYLNDIKAAIATGERAKALVLPLKDNCLTGYALVNLGVAYSRDNQLKKARSLLTSSLTYLAAGDLPPDAPFVLCCDFHELAAIEARLGDNKKAIEYAGKALDALARYKIPKEQRAGMASFREQLIKEKANYETASASK